MIQSTLYPAVPYAKEAGGVNSHFVGILIGNKCLTPPGQNKQTNNVNTAHVTVFVSLNQLLINT